MTLTKKKKRKDDDDKDDPDSANRYGRGYGRPNDIAPKELDSQRTSVMKKSSKDRDSKIGIELNEKMFNSREDYLIAKNE